MPDGTVAESWWNMKKATSEQRSSASLKRFRIPSLRRKKASADEKVGYFAGAWRELRQVRWPDRRAAWSLTFAVILFSLFFAGLIIGVDYAFNELFRKVLL